MKYKVFLILGGVLLIAIIGTIVFFSSYSYDRITFGDDLLVYENVESMSILVTSEYEGRKNFIIPQNRSTLVEAIIRGGGTRKKVSSAYEGNGDRITVSFEDRIRITVVDDPERGHSQTVAGANDLAYITYENLTEGTERYYTLEGFATFKNVYAATSEEAGNVPITDYNGDEDMIKARVQDVWQKISDMGFYSFLLSEESEYIQRKAKKFANEYRNTQIRIKKLGKLTSLETMSVFEYSSIGDGAAFVVGDAVFEEGWETFMMILDAEGNLLDCTVK